jgi:peroxiredoxin family protein
MADETFSLILFSGTDDKLHAAAVLAVGAAAMGRPVNIFLQYWALDAFREDRVRKDHGVAQEAGDDGARAVIEQHATTHWIELFEQAKDIGEVTINACAESMELLSITSDDLHPVVDGVWGVARFFMEAGDGATFI